MKNTLTLLALVCTSHLSSAQSLSESLFEGVNLSVGASQLKTKETTAGTETFKTTVGVAKINYTFALAFPAKLGVTATMDLKNAKAGTNEVLASKTPSELTIEPGILLQSNSLLYAKLGAYAARYENNTDGRALSGKTVGLGIKHYIYDNNFLQFEWTKRTSDAQNAGLANAKYKQTSPSLLFGYTF
jgi:hypothetical protein